jgi:hypothetical protein
MEGVKACRLLRDIFWRCETLQPVSPYTLAIGGIVITGQYAILRSSRRKKHAFALYLRYQGMKMKPLVPDVVSFARWLDLANRWIEPANGHRGIQSIGVMHYWVSRDLSAEHEPDREFATNVLLGAAGGVTGNPFPLPGDHCLSCPTRACRPDDLARPANTQHSVETAGVPAFKSTRHDDLLTGPFLTTTTEYVPGLRQGAVSVGGLI